LTPSKGARCATFKDYEFAVWQRSPCSAVGIVGSVWVRVTELSVLERNGGLKRVVHSAGEVLVLLEANGLVAINNECPHHGAAFTAGYRRDGWIECPLHSWRFDLTTGRGISHPGSCIATYPTRVNDGVVEVELPG
jgi:nitrite reductase/ring-hydroxylating ferredoxin subunit